MWQNIQNMYSGIEYSEVYSVHIYVYSLNTYIYSEYIYICGEYSYASVCTHMPPYASFTLPNTDIQDKFSPKNSINQKQSMSLTFLECVQERKIDPNPTKYSKSDKHILKTESALVRNRYFGILLLFVCYWLLALR